MHRAVGDIIRLGVISAALILAGCQSQQLQPSQTDHEDIRAGRKVVILIGLSATWNGNTVDPIAEFTTMSSMPFQLAVAPLDGEGLLRRRTAFVLPARPQEDRRWVYLIPPPGIYYVWSIPPTLLPRDLKFNRGEAGGLMLEVRTGKQVQYAGTLNFDLAGGKFIMEKFYRRFHVSVLDESHAAASVAGQNLSAHGPMEISLMTRHGTVNSDAGPIFPVSVTAYASDTIDVPDWKRPETEKAMWPSRFFGEVAGGGGDPRGAGGAVFLALAWYPIGAFVGGQRGELLQAEYQPCLTGLQEAMEAMKPGVLLREKLADALGRLAVVCETGPDATDEVVRVALRQGCRTALIASVRRIRLRECTTGRFCVEVAVRFRLLDTASSRCVLDQTILYTSPGAAASAGETEPDQLEWMLAMPFPPPHELCLASGSEERTMDAYCGQNGQHLFAGEVMRAIDLAIQQFVAICHEKEARSGR